MIIMMTFIVFILFIYLSDLLIFNYICKFSHPMEDLVDKLLILLTI